MKGPEQGGSCGINKHGRSVINKPQEKGIKA